jgi:hypothetical protein
LQDKTQADHENDETLVVEERKEKLLATSTEESKTNVIFQESRLIAVPSEESKDNVQPVRDRLEVDEHLDMLMFLHGDELAGNDKRRGYKYCCPVADCSEKCIYRTRELKQPRHCKKHTDKVYVLTK